MPIPFFENAPVAWQTTNGSTLIQGPTCPFVENSELMLQPHSPLLLLVAQCRSFARVFGRWEDSHWQHGTKKAKSQRLPRDLQKSSRKVVAHLGVNLGPSAQAIRGNQVGDGALFGAKTTPLRGLRGKGLCVSLQRKKSATRKKPQEELGCLINNQNFFNVCKMREQEPKTRGIPKSTKLAHPFLFD